MNYSNKKIISLLLSGAITLGVCAPTVSAAENSRRRYNPSYLSDVAYDQNVYSMTGMYTEMLDKLPVYVYLANGVDNEYLEKNEALYVAEMNYDNTYIFKKTAVTYYYDSRNRRQEEKVTVYAISDKKTVSNYSGWTRVDKSDVRRTELVATSIELGEFLLKDIDLSSYYYNADGFALVDLNKDGKNTELMYLGNDKENKVYKKAEAIKYAVENYDTYYILRKRIPIKGSYRSNYVYAISEKSYVEGWSKVSKRDIKEDEVIATNIEYMEALVNIYDGDITVIKDNSNKITDDNNSNNENNNNGNNNNTNENYSYMLKNEALAFAYQNYADFCILSREFKGSTIYAFSSSLDVQDWDIVGNDEINENSNIFLTINDANKYIYAVTYSNAKKLTR